MLIEFSIGNYRSFRNRKTLSMEAADISSQPPSLDKQNVFEVDPAVRLLTSAVIYGANASGKSNLVAAIDFMRRFVLTSAVLTRFGQPINVEPFRLSTVTESQPSEFEMVFLVDGVQYRYGFAVDRRHIVREWLYRLGTLRESKLFTRTGQQIEVNPRIFREGRRLESLTRPNALFLSVVAQFNGPIAKQLTNWFAALDVNTGVTDWEDMALALARFDDSPYRSTIEELIQRLDTGIEHVEAERIPLTMDAPFDAPDDGSQSVQRTFDAPSDVSDVVTQSMHRLLDELSRFEKIERVRIKTYHQRFDGEGYPADSVAFDLEQHESAGKQRLFVLAQPIVHALQEGGGLVIDEFDARIHPNLAVELVRLFKDTETKPHHAKIIF